ncbi:hypothetical protein C8F01DRAFT_1135418 [Mycena amicta]|nr:hypothetical protein C8F01DRAFT_1135418 [Mycena amicta]
MRLSIFKSLTRLSRRRRKTATQSLPLEIWDCIFEYLSDERILVMARVCKLFNERCISTHFLRHDITPEDLEAGHLKVHSDDLRILLLHTYLRQTLKTLDCTIDIEDNLQALSALTRIIELSPQFHSLQIRFVTEAKHPCAYQYAPDHTGSSSQRDAIFRKLLRALSVPVAFVSNGGIFMVQPRDLGEWNVNAVGPSIGHFSWLKKEGYNTSGYSRIGFIVSRGFGKSAKEIYLEPIYSASFQRVGVADNSKASPFVLVTINSEKACKLDLRPPMVDSDLPASNAQLTAILRHISLPALSTLVIATAVEPSVLGDFLQRHDTSLEVLDLACTTGTFQLASHNQRIHLPALKNIICPHPQDLQALLDSLDSIPLLDHVFLPYARSDGAFALALRRLSLLGLTSSGITLELDVPTAALHSALPSEPHDYECQVISTLFCVHRIRILVSRAVDAFPMLPWLAMFPAIRSILFLVKVMSKQTPYDQTRQLEQQTRIMLPWVGDVRVVWDYR